MFNNYEKRVNIKGLVIKAIVPTSRNSSTPFIMELILHEDYMRIKKGTSEDLVSSQIPDYLESLRKEYMNINSIVYRKATKHDVTFMSEILVDAAAVSEVNILVCDLSNHSDTYQYVEGFPNGSDIGIIAETNEGLPVGAAWVRMLPTDAHAINQPLPELTMGVIPEYRRMGIGERLMEELYKAALKMGIPVISLGVHRDNLPAINLCKKQGWVEDGSFKEYIMMSRKTT